MEQSNDLICFNLSKQQKEFMPWHKNKRQVNDFVLRYIKLLIALSPLPD